ncbi:hypothetical protein [Ahrensia kielensis]|uniref:hypothetical protein n=1 Tax=Ahrensia kielensis TaxID=76980 RepID=UPI00037B7731|nr:hypothetical protein [Ahrensia kielensis]
MVQIGDIANVIDSGDLFNWAPLDDELQTIATIKALNWKPLGNPSEVIYHMTSMLTEIKRKRSLLGSDISDEELAIAYRWIRMELSRHEREPEVTQELLNDLQQIQNGLAATTAALNAKKARLSRTEHTLKNCAADQSADINRRLNSETQQVEQLQEMADELALEEFILSAAAREVGHYITNTNDGLHVQEIDASKVRKTDEPTMRFLENLTKIWAEYADPELGLPLRSEGETNPFIRYLQSGLLFFKHADLSPLQLNSLVAQHFKKALVSE